MNFQHHSFCNDTRSQTKRHILDFLKTVEEDDFDGFLTKLACCRVDYVHPLKEHAWGQRVVRFYDPDRHMIEVGENIQVVCRRFLASGMTPEQTAARMDVPLDFINSCLL